MRHNQGQNQKRSRGRGRRNSNHGQTNFNRNTTFDSNGPDGRLRGNALQLYEKYTALAHDANAAGERISAEALAQFADHYYRINQTILQAADQHRRNQEERQQQNRKPESAASETPEKSDDGVKAAEMRDEEAVETGAQTSAAAGEAVA
tara:strand:- start:456 stop:902 length:447 start_codon:yes stop_codon:yes gene_type:complete